MRTYNCEFLVKAPQCQFCEDFRTKALNQNLNADINKPATRKSARKSKPSAKLKYQETVSGSQIEEIEDKKRATKRRRLTSDVATEENDHKDEPDDDDSDEEYMSNDEVDDTDENLQKQKPRKKRDGKSAKVCKICDATFRLEARLKEHVTEV